MMMDHVKENVSEPVPPAQSTNKWNEMKMTKNEIHFDEEHSIGHDWQLTTQFI